MGMILRRSAAPATFDAPRALTSSAAVLKSTSSKDANASEVAQASSRRAAAEWQQEAWLYYDEIGEIKYIFNLIANIASRIRVYPAVVRDDGATPDPVSDVDDLTPRLADAANRVVASLRSRRGGQAALLRAAALNFGVTGECYLVKQPALIGSGLPATWDIVSTDELSVSRDGQFILKPRSNAPTSDQIVLPSGSFVARMWRSHPRYTDESDSSLRGVLDNCAELLLINRTFRATARSRLNAGVLYVPDGLSIASTTDADEEAIEGGVTEEEDSFEQDLMSVMMMPIEDETSAAAVVPLIIRGPEDLGDKIKHFQFERSFDPSLAARADRLLERIMQGLDAPKEVVTGLSSLKYSNAYEVNESMYRGHVEPLAMLICDALTTAFLHPHLEAMGFTKEQAQRVVLWYDPSAITIRPEAGKDADTGYDRGLLSGKAWRDAHGFTDADSPNPEETVMRIALERGSLPPELTEALLQQYAPDVFQAVKQEHQAEAEEEGIGLPPEVQQALGEPPSQAGA